MMSGRLSEADLLREAREGLSPSAEAEARVWTRLGAAVLVSPSSPSPEAYGSSSASAGHTVASGIGGVKLAAIALGVGVTLGFGAGYMVGSHGARSRAIASEVATKTIQRPMAPPEPITAPAESPVDQVAVDPVRRQVESAAPTKERRSSDSPRRGAQSLAEEVDTLVRARRALAHGNTQLALGLLAELDKSHPEGALGQERQATRILALCTANRIPEGPLAAERFVSETPSSIYAARIREACGLPGVTEPDKAGH